MTRAIAYLTHENKVLGTAFAISRSAVLTAFHCIGNRESGAVAYPRVVVHFPNDQAIEADVRHDASDPYCDFATLALSSPAAGSLEIIQLSRESAVAERFESPGFPQFSRDIDLFTVHGDIVASTTLKRDEPVLQLRCQEDDIPLNGLSGAPVLVSGRAVGLIRWTPATIEAPGLQRGAVYACPISAVFARSPGLYKRPVHWIVKTTRDPLNIGRDAELQQLHKMATKGSNTRVRHIGVTGLSGIGKTHLVLEYVHRYQTEFEVILWVSCDNKEALLQRDLSIISHEWRLPESQDLNRLLTQIAHHLENYEPWILVLDGIDDIALLTRLALPVSGNGRILVTSQSQTLSTLSEYDTLEVGELDEPEALQLLLQRSGRGTCTPEDLRRASGIVRQLGRFPLAIELAGAYLKEVGSSFEEWLELFKKAPLPMFDKRPALVKYPRSLKAAWSMNFGELQQRSSAAADLLMASAYFFTAEIPFDLILGGARKLGPQLAAKLGRRSLRSPAAVAELRELLGELRRFSFVKHEPGSTSYRVYDLVRIFIRHSLDSGGQDMWTARSLQAYRSFLDACHPTKDHLAIETLADVFVEYADRDRADDDQSAVACIAKVSPDLMSLVARALTPKRLQSHITFLICFCRSTVVRCFDRPHVLLELQAFLIQRFRPILSLLIVQRIWNPVLTLFQAGMRDPLRRQVENTLIAAWDAGSTYDGANNAFFVLDNGVCQRDMLLSYVPYMCAVHNRDVPLISLADGSPFLDLSLTMLNFRTNSIVGFAAYVTITLAIGDSPEAASKVVSKLMNEGSEAGRFVAVNILEALSTAHPWLAREALEVMKNEMLPCLLDEPAALAHLLVCMAHIVDTDIEIDWECVVPCLDSAFAHIAWHWSADDMLTFGKDVRWATFPKSSRSGARLVEYMLSAGYLADDSAWFAATCEICAGMLIKNRAELLGLLDIYGISDSAVQRIETSASPAAQDEQRWLEARHEWTVFFFRNMVGNTKLRYLVLKMICSTAFCISVSEWATQMGEFMIELIRAYAIVDNDEQKYARLSKEDICALARLVHK